MISDYMIKKESTVEKSAEISKCGYYRYLLTRRWSEDQSMVLWIMLNPSTADATEDDPTVRRCMSFAKEWGYGGIHVVNLFAYRTPIPSVLSNKVVAPDPIGPDNDYFIRGYASQASRVICAWGNHGAILGREFQVMKLLGNLRVSASCLGQNKNGTPKHPLYIALNTPLQKYL